PGFPAGGASRPLLYRVLLVADAADVRCRGWESRVDAGLGYLDGHRKKSAMGPTLQRSVGYCAALLGTHHRSGSGARIVMIYRDAGTRNRWAPRRSRITTLYLATL